MSIHLFFPFSILYTEDLHDGQKIQSIQIETLLSRRTNRVGKQRPCR